MSITKNIIAIIIILAAVITLFWQVNEVGAELIRWASGIVIGYYFAGSVVASKLGLTSGQK